MPGGRGLFSLPSLFGSFASRQCFSFFNSFTSIYFRTLSANWPTETRDILCELNSLRALAKDGGWTSLGIPAKIYLPPFPSLTIFPSHFLFERSFLLAPHPSQLTLRPSRPIVAHLFSGSRRLLQKFFLLEENGTTVRRELLSGLTTFLAMAYIVVVNPRILAEAGMPADGVLFATCVSAAFATLVMGLRANYPIALAPGMSLNAYFTYSVVIGRGVPWQTALGVVFLSGVVFLLLTLTKIRERIVN